MSHARKFAVIDAETDPFKNERIPQPFIWGFYDGNEYKEFKTASEMVNFLRKMRIVVYAHNGGRFDYHFMASDIEPYTEILVIDGRLAQFKIWDCEFRDSYNILPSPLANYRKREIDYSKLEPENRAANFQEIREYLRSDCENLWHWIAEFHAEYGRHLTLARAAMNVWQKKFSDGSKAQTDEKFYNRFVEFYSGGRVEAIRKGIFEGHFYIADLNSAYPKAMQSMHPWGDIFVVREKPNFPIKPNNLYVIQAKSFGALPYKANGFLEFPRDGVNHMFSVTGWEIAQGVESDTIEIDSIVREYEFIGGMEFSAYVNHFYRIKQTAAPRSASYTFAKLFLNSLYGKFGANPERYFEHFLAPADKIELAVAAGYEFAGTFAHHAVIRKPIQDEQKRYYNVATAASITGAVRAMLWKAYQTVVRAGGTVYYCDTDSLIFECPGKNPLPVSDDIGAWKIEMECDRIAIAGKKLYAAHNANPAAPKDEEWKTASKGVRLTPAEIFDVARGKKVLHKPLVPTFSIYSGIKFVDREIKMT